MSQEEPRTRKKTSQSWPPAGRSREEKKCVVGMKEKSYFQFKKNRILTQEEHVPHLAQVALLPLSLCETSTTIRDMCLLHNPQVASFSLWNLMFSTDGLMSPSHLTTWPISFFPCFTGNFHLALSLRT